MDRITFELSWVRTSRVSPTVRETMKVTLREGGTVPLDLVHGRPDGNCANVMIDATTTIVEDRAFENKLIDWDIWWTSSPQAQPIQMRVTSRQGDDAAFEFAPIPFETASSSTTLRSALVVYGKLRGRIGPDGRIDVSLTTGQVVSTTTAAQPRRPRFSPLAQPLARGAGESGQKFFTVQPDEAIRVVLPPIDRRVVVSTDSNARQRVTIRPSAPDTTSAPMEMSLVIRARVR